jgi:hypothetical protein
MDSFSRSINVPSSGGSSSRYGAFCHDAFTMDFSRLFIRWPMMPAAAPFS